MPSPAEVASQLVQALSVVEPDLDTSAGTPIRKILDTVAEAISSASIDSMLLTYSYDVDSRSGADLDAFCALFGMSRYPARRATGSVLFQRSSLATQSSMIPAGSQLATSDSPPLIVQTTASVIFPASQLSITVPVQSVTGGSNGNLPANSIVRMISVVDGVGTVSNPASLTGGSDGESDAQLRDRFKRTIFRNLAGTEDMYLGVALNDSDVTNANVIGPSERWRERLEIVSGTGTSMITPLDRGSFTITAASNATPIVVTTLRTHPFRVGDVVRISGVVGNTNANGTFRVKAVPSATTFSLRALDDSADIAGSGAYTSGGTVTAVTRARYVYAEGYAVGADLDGGSVLTPNVHYSFSQTNIPPTVTAISSTYMPDGIYDVSMQYAPVASRNDPQKGITNRVDVWTTGSRATAAVESTVLDGRVVISAITEPYAKFRFRRLNGQPPTAGNAFLQLGFAPVLGVSGSLTIGSYTVPTDKYRVIQETGAGYGSTRSLDGIEIDAAEVQTGTISITSSTNASPIVITTSTTHNFKVGQQIVVSGHTTNTNANGTWTVSAATSNTVTLSGSTGNGVGGATGSIYLYSPVSISYTYNDIPRAVQQQVESWRLLTTDALVHHGRQINLKIHVAVILKPGYTVASVQTPVNTVVSSFLDGLGFGATMQVSDLLNVIGDVAGIDAVRLLTSDDMTARTVTAATNATPIVVTTSTNHGLSVGDMVIIDGAVGNTAANGTWIASAVTSNTITLLDSVGNGVWSSGGRVVPANFGVKIMGDDGTSNVNIIVGGDGTPYRAKDLAADDHEFFVLSSVAITSKAPNTFGVA